MNFVLFGYPKTGKTTLFNLLTGAKVAIKGFTKGKEDPNARTCPVPDERFEKLSALYPDKKKKPAMIDYVDLAGLSYGEMKNSVYMDHLRRADGLCHVVRAFQDDRIPHARDAINPEEDIRSVEEEILLTDLIAVESRINGLEKELKKSKSPEGEKDMELLRQLHSALSEGKAIREIDLSVEENRRTKSFALLSQKPLIHMVNVAEEEISMIETPEKFYSGQQKQMTVMGFCGKIELEILELDAGDMPLFLKEYGLQELCISRFLKTSFKLLDVITFFTVGKEEVKAWTANKNSTALAAAGMIHSDIERGFIKAETISWHQLLEHGSFQEAREKAAIRFEGKDYRIQDGDVVFFRFSK